MLIFRQLFDQQSSTYTYLLADPASRESVLIDPVFEQVPREIALIEELGLRLRMSLETHVHADHVTGGWLLRQRLGSRIAVSDRSGAEGADIYFGEGDKLKFGGRHLTVLATPGHTGGCSTFVLDDASMAFTGDCVLIRGCGRTDFQQGDPAAMYASVHNKIFSLPDECLLYPAHDYRGSTVTSVAEEKIYNPRLGTEVGLEDFRGYMENLGLPHPKQIDIAVPANLKCGEPAKPASAANEPVWAPLTFTYAGFWELQPGWLEEHRSQVQVVDVREREEFEGILGHIEGATLIPLGQLQDGAARLHKDKPVVTVCRSGARSAQAVMMLEKQGFGMVANLAGGMLRWRSQRLPVEAAAD
ncbi:rhodanese-like domain-containing protein [Novosphingobium pentaromativorans]|nr:MBL fold metallo-hydrolase [Novosphingobium pentaromativorans]